MIDLHCHILYDTDDGPKTIEESVSIIQEAVNAGFTKICITPHYIKPQYVKTKKQNIEKLNNIKKIIKEKNINVELFLGNEIYITENVDKLVVEEEVSTLAETKFILIEFPMCFGLIMQENEIDKLISKGYNIILAHPERYVYVQKNISYLDKYIEKGVYLQGNYESLLGKYGNTAKKTLIKLIKDKKIDLLATDTHRQNSTYFKMDKILKKLKKYAKDEYYYEITEKKQENILNFN